MTVAAVTWPRSDRSDQLDSKLVAPAMSKRNRTVPWQWQGTRRQWRLALKV